MNLDVSHETLKRYAELVIKWNKSVNLISAASETVIWDRHIADSIQLENFVLDKYVRVFDFGSGAGFPGIPLSILGVKNINLVEIDVRKCAFLRKAQSVLGLDLEIHNRSIEEIYVQRRDCIISRAMFSVSRFCEYLSKFEAECFLLKGQRYQQELNEASKIWVYDYKIYPSITNDHSVIIKLFNVQKI